MSSAGPASRFSLAGLLRWTSVPGSPAEVRAFLQRRVALYLGFSALLWGTGALATIALTSMSRGETVDTERLQNLTLHLLCPVGLAFLSLAARRGERSPTWLAVADQLATLLQGVALGLMIQWSIAVVRFRPDLLLIFGFTYVVITRAAVVPSSAGRTALVGCVTAVPVLIGVYLLYRRAFALGPPAFHPYPQTSAPLYTVAAGVTCGLSLALSVFVSSVIYGLQRVAQQARQLGQYFLEGKIGEGGMGVVYRARHALLRRPTAIKLLPPERAGVDTIARFEREVQVTSQLSHPNTVAIHDYGRTPENLFYYAMEYLDGVDLESLVRLDGPQPPGRVRHLLRQVLGSLAEAHARGLIHRDIKPSNVMLCERGLIPDFVKVLDFGLVRDFTTDGDSQVTGARVLTGTPLYMSPEQIRGEPLDGRSDLYAVAAVGYHLLAGQPLFLASTAVQIWAHHLHTPVEPPSTQLGQPLPPALEAWLLRCLQKQPADRPADALAMRAALDACPDVPPWDEAQAARWWRERAPQLRASLQAASGSGAETVAVDLGDRLPREAPAVGR